MKDNIKEILDIIDRIGAENPYKIPGMPETYEKYNEGWCDACDRISGEIESYLKNKKTKYYVVYDFENKNMEIGTGYTTLTFVEDSEFLTEEMIVKARKIIEKEYDLDNVIVTNMIKLFN